MSPAAQHLLRKSTGNTPRAQSGFSDALRSSYGGSSLGVHTPRGIKRPGATPTPIFRAGATPTPLFKAGATPSTKSTMTKKQR